MNIDFAFYRTYRLWVMFDDDPPVKKTHEFPRNLENASIEELQDYIKELKDEITRVEEDISKKKSSADAANSIFK